MKILSIEQPRKIEILSANIFFQGLDKKSLDELSLHTSLYQFERGEALFWEGDPCPGLYILETGSVKLFRVSAQGRQHILRVAQEGETFNEVPVFDGGENPVNVEALETSTVWVVQAEAVHRLLQNDPEYARRIIRSLGKMLRHLVQMTSEMAFLQIPHRLARLINEMPAHELSGEGGIRWTQEQMAARLGTVREVVARALRELERSGAIQMENRRISIVNYEILQQWAQSWN
ncbi:MAG: Crp/Fnr family transcriptional regulator [Anaerolineales bacterium]|jgi:CRP/FNR family transcriptional regulator|nr:Crp/Fnr family transcriptional regulator [Anaerolineales bacterium]